MKEVLSLPNDPKGYGDVRIAYSPEQTVVEFEYGDEDKPSMGILKFDWVVLFKIESENNPDVSLPNCSGTLYEKPAARKGFRRLVVWLSNNSLIEVECRAFQAQI